MVEVNITSALWTAIIFFLVVFLFLRKWPDYEVEQGEVSDGYHTFNELYDHRSILFISLMKSNPELSWAARHHKDGTSYEGHFIAGMNLPSGDISYHLPDRFWVYIMGLGIDCSSHAPEWDGYTPGDVVTRLTKWNLERSLT